MIKIDAIIIMKFEIFKIFKLSNLVETRIKNQYFDRKEVILIFLDRFDL